jgi:hypothetical protein
MQTRLKKLLVAGAAIIVLVAVLWFAWPLFQLFYPGIIIGVIWVVLSIILIRLLLLQRRHLATKIASAVLGLIAAIGLFLVFIQVYAWVDPTFFGGKLMLYRETHARRFDPGVYTLKGNVTEYAFSYIEYQLSGTTGKRIDYPHLPEGDTLMLLGNGWYSLALIKDGAAQFTEPKHRTDLWWLLTNVDTYLVTASAS